VRSEERGAGQSGVVCEIEFLEERRREEGRETAMLTTNKVEFDSHSSQ
jgi:hypothetical protein